MLNYNYYYIDKANDIIACDPHMTITYNNMQLPYTLNTVTWYILYTLLTLVMTQLILDSDIT